MADVRLTATNPDDSSVVPVACNAKGELLITEPVIEEISNDVTITGSLQAGTAIDAPASLINGVRFYSNKGTVVFQADGAATSSWDLRNDGYAKFNRSNTSGYGSVGINDNTKGLAVYSESGALVWSVGYTGVTRASSLMLQLEPDNPANFRTVGDGEESTTEYVGPELDVLQALVALKDEVQRLEEKLNMVPSAGWDVWDGTE